MGMTSTEQLKKERSDFYRLGYKTGYLSLVNFLKETMSEEEFDLYRHKIKNHYDKYPFMDFIKEIIF